MPIRQGAYGYKKGPRDLNSIVTIEKFSTGLIKTVLPNSVDLRNPAWISPCYDQLQTSSCVLNAWASLVEYGQRRTPGGPTWTPSRLFAYWNVREIEGDTDEDAGSFVHDAFHQARYVGIIPETDYPFSEDINVITSRPPQICFDNAKKIQPKNFASLDNGILDELKTCLAHGFPFAMGFQVPAVFETEAFSKDPQLHVPSRFARFVSGHGTSYFGYDDNKAQFIGRNSWGPDWGDHGYFYVDYEFMISTLVSDANMVRFPGQERSFIAA